MKNKRHSIKDIASKLNVSVTTVSFVLNGKAKEMRISDMVAKKIIEYTEKINYKPNRVAQSLRTGKSKIIVFMVEDISNFFFAKIARIIEDIAYEKGYKVLFCSNENEDGKSLELIDLFKVLQVDGYILIPSGGIEDKIASLISENIPVVLFDRYFPGLETNYVIIDNENASFYATAHLAENKFQNIGFITTDVKQTQMLDRLQGYKMAIKEHDLNENILQISYKEKASAIGKKNILEFFRNNSKLDSVFFCHKLFNPNWFGSYKGELSIPC
jgi:LacI family transcriptional regulator